MPNDAKFGLVVGVGLVIAVAIVFFRKDLPGPKAALRELPAETAALASETPAQTSVSRVFQATTASRQEEVHEGQTIHVIAEGDTLFTIAQRYYGNGDRFFDVYQANRDVLATPDHLPVGKTLRLPK